MTRYPDLETVGKIMVETAGEEILPRFRRLQDGDIREKSPGELVTVADEASEVRLTERLGELMPGSLVVGEEAVSRDAEILTRINADEPVWIIDPLDGTTNFANGNAAFAMIVALVHRGETVAGWILDPNLQRLAVVERGGGAFLAGERMQVSRDMAVADMRAILTERYFTGGLLAGVRALQALIASTRPFSCAGLAYLDLCSGAAEIAAPARLRPWDHVAGALMHREAGGHNALADDRPYTARVNSGLFIVAPDGATWVTVRDVIAAGVAAQSIDGSAPPPTSTR